MTRRLVLLIFVFALTIPHLPAQEGDQAATSTASDPQVSKEILRLELDPLTKQELETEADAWQALLKENAGRIAGLEIQSIRGTGDNEEIQKQLIALREEKVGLVSRLEIVLDAYDLKGGDTAERRKYLAAVRGIKTGVNDVNTRVQAFNSWFTSQEGGIKVAINALKFVGIIVVFWFIAFFSSKLIHRAVEKQPHLSSLLKVFISRMSRRVILAVGLVVALATVGVNVGAALALIGGGAFILAFALQDTLSNFAAGVMLIIYRPFDVGDAVELGAISGTVDSVSLVSTTIRTFDNKKVLVPNNKVWGETITNITGMPTRRVDLIFGIGYDDDADKAQEILERIVAENELCLDVPEPAIHLHELGESSVNFICRPWANTADHWTVYWAITKRVKKEFDAAGISIPYPQTDVHLHTVAPASGNRESSGDFRKNS